ncbi:MAG: hypothetical protein M3177_11055, partial [Pseudomonadota bacterium]|nr:hypothetical protein [Pseudomonadota bacterium]
MRTAAGLPEPVLRGITRSNLCRAAVGEIAINQADLCASFGDQYSGRDELERSAQAIRFGIEAEVPRARTSRFLHIDVLPSDARCSSGADFLLAAGQGRIIAVPFLADHIVDGTVRWREASWNPSTERNLAVEIRDLSEERREVQPDEAPAATNPPPSWGTWARGEAYRRLVDFLWVPSWALVVVAGFMMFGGALLYAEAEPPLAAVVKALAGAIALYAAARWSAAALDLARLAWNPGVSPERGWAAALRDSIGADLGYEVGHIVAAAIIMTALTGVLWPASLLAGAPRPGASLLRHSVRLLLRTLAVGSLVAWSFLVLSAVGAAALPRQTPFEPLALAVSFFLALWAVLL